MLLVFCCAIVMNAPSPPLRSCRLLSSTDAAGMGCDQQDVDMVVILDLGNTEWKLSQKVCIQYAITSTLLIF